jgi:hypothetical protein
MKGKCILLVIIALTALALQASASDRFQIVVHYNDGKLASNAHVEIWDGGNRVDEGNTDDGGAYYSWLERSINYRITANGNGQFGEWQGFPGGEIHIYMHY